jgi:hypothetical protein
MAHRFLLSFHVIYIYIYIYEYYLGQDVNHVFKVRPKHHFQRDKQHYLQLHLSYLVCGFLVYTIIFEYILVYYGITQNTAMVIPPFPFTIDSEEDPSDFCLEAFFHARPQPLCGQPSGQPGQASLMPLFLQCSSNNPSLAKQIAE